MTGNARASGCPLAIEKKKISATAAMPPIHPYDLRRAFT
jgi:hypothetical protein